MQKLPLRTLSALSCSILTSQFAHSGNYIESTYIEPPMVAVPKGDFLMGSTQGRDDEKPQHRVFVSAFQMGKYEVTIAEFRKFVEQTGYPTVENCNHRIGKKWFGSGKKDGSWDNNIYAHSEFHPVVCVTRKDAIAYADWLSKQTGKHYRLPTEAEWEYALRGGTHTRYFYGDKPLSGQACKYANLSDLHAKTQSPKQYNAVYNDRYTIEPCHDYEVTTAVVGLYEPNPFGIHDMLGNVVERLADCYQENYNKAPNDGSAVVKEGCDAYVARGSSWHWEASTSSARMRMREDFIAALEGFRLALDTNGKALESQTGNKSFVKALTQAQQQARQNWQKKDAQLKSTSANGNTGTN
ncbi:SUMF1/EgtB/PvdO family nonheme iron enzyme [Pseudoalteromonas sp. MMG022]|uniref:SUMF1/EgtB/PvdO family nonheme iron enzyme n=1 Tax=Pseudoalteromonas sp. MMG022 TaxID=2909978 RepID=UPI001F24B961|nr:SUMF1/EgtB/PvdO family nonheme iron enzyme [Pseudoalteromonas sp. MMG022]MCF6434806.1 SUMF1/EgtB/PvdO family nonheme iron enzyme [Pseudoalteromonas sp. MMG022]